MPFSGVNLLFGLGFIDLYGLIADQPQDGLDILRCLALDREDNGLDTPAPKVVDDIMQEF